MKSSKCCRQYHADISAAAGLKSGQFNQKKLCSLVSVVFGLLERFLTAITGSIVAAPIE